MATNRPWVVVGDEPRPAGFYDTPNFLLPGALARWQREEAAIRAEEQRKESERQERADARQQLAMWSARQHAIARGLPWDPAKPFEHMPNVYARADISSPHRTPKPVPPTSGQPEKPRSSICCTRVSNPRPSHLRATLPRRRGLEPWLRRRGQHEPTRLHLGSGQRSNGRRTVRRGPPAGAPPATPPPSAPTTTNR